RVRGVWGGVGLGVGPAAERDRARPGLLFGGRFLVSLLRESFNQLWLGFGLGLGLLTERHCAGPCLLLRRRFVRDGCDGLRIRPAAERDRAGPRRLFLGGGLLGDEFRCGLGRFLLPAEADLFLPDRGRLVAALLLGLLRLRWLGIGLLAERHRAGPRFAFDRRLFRNGCKGLGVALAAERDRAGPRGLFLTGRFVGDGLRFGLGRLLLPAEADLFLPDRGRLVAAPFLNLVGVLALAPEAGLLLRDGPVPHSSPPGAAGPGPRGGGSSASDALRSAARSTGKPERSSRPMSCAGRLDRESPTSSSTTRRMIRSPSDCSIVCMP